MQPTLYATEIVVFCPELVAWLHDASHSRDSDKFKIQQLRVLSRPPSTSNHTTQHLMVPTLSTHAKTLTKGAQSTVTGFQTWDIIIYTLIQWQLQLGRKVKNNKRYLRILQKIISARTRAR